MTERRYLALVGDLVHSRSNEARAEVQAFLIRWLDEQSEAADEGTYVARPQLTAGDEIQCLLGRPDAAMGLIQELTDRLLGAPLKQGIAFGLGWGTLSTVGSNADLTSAYGRVSILDGECFHLAREALKQARKERSWAVCRGLGEPFDGALTALFRLMWAIRERWTTTQAVLTYARRGYPTQKETAEDAAGLVESRLGKTVGASAISQSLKAARFSAILAGEDAAQGLLAKATQTEQVSREHG